MHAPGIAVPKLQRTGATQEVVVLYRFGEGGNQFAFGSQVRRPFQFLLDAVGDGDLTGVDLQTGELFVGLAHLFLQVLVAGSERIGLALQGVVVGYLPGHAGITGDESEYRKTTDQSESENGVYSFVGDMDAPESAAKGVS